MISSRKWGLSAEIGGNNKKKIGSVAEMYEGQFMYARL